MRLRNKKTGEIGYFCFANWDSPVLIIMDKNGVQLAKYNSLADLNAEWKDYEEPKSWWFIDCNGEVYIGDYAVKEHTEQHKLIGNYFPSKEKAEQAVEKLKAWKRLKDKGFRFSKDWVYRYDQPKVENHTYFEFVAICENGIRFDDLDLLFGGKE